MPGLVRRLVVDGLAGFTIAAIAFGLASCNSFNRKLETEPIAGHFSANEQAPLVLADVYGQLKWDRVYIFAPYTSIDTINQTLGYAWATERKTSIYQNDGISLLVFTAAGKVVGYVEYPRGKGDFAALAKQEGYSPEEAVFMVDRSTSNQSWTKLVLVDE
jgi:hypothetical protein